jgi:ubiquinone/menaquinone biosynthesis C-methylase UbiE
MIDVKDGNDNAQRKEKKKGDGPFPSWLSFLLNNPIRRHFDPPQKVIETIVVSNDDVVLDFGCGPGFYTIPFAKVAKQVVALDLQPKMLQKVEKEAKKHGVAVQCLQSDGKQIPLPDRTFDLVFLGHVYHEIRDKENVLAELRRLLKSGGKLVIMESTKKVLLGPPAMDTEEIRTELKAAGFSTVEITGMKNRGLVTAVDHA